MNFSNIYDFIPTPITTPECPTISIYAADGACDSIHFKVFAATSFIQYLPVIYWFEFVQSVKVLPLPNIHLFKAWCTESCGYNFMLTIHVVWRDSTFCSVDDTASLWDSPLSCCVMVGSSEENMIQSVYDFRKICIICQYFSWDGGHIIRNWMELSLAISE